jgi:DNA-binding MarR family transcriptional regulator
MQTPPAPDSSGDAVDRIREEWMRLRPELDTSVLEVVGRVLRSAGVITRRGDEFLTRFGLTRGEFDLLAALRRSGEPQSPGALRTVSAATGPAITKRLRSLEERSLIRRSPNPSDGRGALVRLSAEGAALIDDVFPRLLELERELVGGISSERIADIAASLREVLASVEGAGRSQTTE